MMFLENYQFNYYSKGGKHQPAILFLHGFMGSCHDFDEISDRLAENFYCLAIDLPGHGKTTVRGEADNYTMARTAVALIEWLNRLDIEKTFLVGYSMGGRLALYMMLHYPERFERVVLESASPGLKTEEARSQRQEADRQLAQKLKTSDFQDFLWDWYRQPLFKSLKDRPAFEKILERRLENNPIELAKSLQFMGTGSQPSLWDRLTHNQIPLLLLVGEKDEKFRNINAEMANICPKAQLEVISQAGHNIHLENQKAYLQSIKHFFQQPIDF